MTIQGPKAMEKLQFEGAADSQTPGVLRDFASSLWLRRAALGTGSRGLQAFWPMDFGSRAFFSSNLLTWGQSLFTMKFLEVFIMHL